jgi:mRNA interferase YafQ
MLILVWESQFKRDFGTATKRNKDLQKLANIIKDLQLGKTLLQKNRDHKLKGNYSNCRECHIEPDWLLIYKKTKSELILVRTGSHSDLF